MTSVARLARLLAVAIAVLGVVDPAIATSRRVPATVAVLDTLRAGRPAGVVEDVARALDVDYRVVRGRVAGAAATVIVGDRLPPDADEVAAPAFAVRPDDAAPAVIVTDVQAPARAALESRVPVRVSLDAIGVDGRTIAIALRRGAVVLDRVERQARGARARIDVGLSFVSGAPGVAALQVEATVAGALPARADLAIDVRHDRARVLFFEGRPSWLSTFVRRTLENDARFEVAQRTRTARGLGAATAGAPGALSRLDAIVDFDAVVVSAPESLSRADVAGLGSYARARGGAVILLLDADPGAALEPLVGIERWQLSTLPEPEGVDLSAIGLGRVQAAEFVWPAAAPPRARVLARAGAQARPVLFEVPVGAGHLLVSGLTDAWRYRGGDAGASFGEMWPLLIGAAARTALPPVDVAIAPSAAAPGAQIAITVALRDVLLGSSTPSETRIAAAMIDAAGVSTPVRLWPDGPPGFFRGSFRAPDGPGSRRLRVTAGDATAEAPVIVVDSARQPEKDDTEAIAAWAAARGGGALSAGNTDELRAALAAALPEVRADVRWHVLRSPWWIVPFALTLGLEWRDRRRRRMR